MRRVSPFVAGGQPYTGYLLSPPPLLLICLFPSFVSSTFRFQLFHRLFRISTYSDNCISHLTWYTKKKPQPALNPATFPALRSPVQSTMPARTRQGPSAATTTTTEEQVVDQPEAEETPDEPEPRTSSGGLRKLKFNEPITWRVGRAAIPIADLLQRLQTLAGELRKMEQEEVETGSLTKVAQELATPQLLGHKDKGVRAWAGCCIVDVLRLCAPDAPFTGNQLKVWRCSWIEIGLGRGSFVLRVRY